MFKMKLLPQEGVTPKNPGDTDRTKYLVALGIDDSKILVGSVLINSHINDSFGCPFLFWGVAIFLPKTFKVWL